MGIGRLTGHRLKGACTFLAHSLDGLGACLNDKEGSTEIQQGWTTVGGQNVFSSVCLGLFWKKPLLLPLFVI